jgi:hypothetical protein
MVGGHHTFFTSWEEFKTECILFGHQRQKNIDFDIKCNDHVIKLQSQVKYLNLGVFDRKHILLGSIHPDFDIIQLGNK